MKKKQMKVVLYLILGYLILVRPEPEKGGQPLLVSPTLGLALKET